MFWDKIAIAFSIVIALLLVALSFVGYLLNDTYKALKTAEVRVEECLVSLESLNATIAKANAQIAQLKVDAKNYNYTKNKLQAELNKVYEEFNGATSCKGIVTNIVHTFETMEIRLREVEEMIEVNEALLPPHIRQFHDDIDSKPTYILTNHTQSNMTPYFKRR